MKINSRKIINNIFLPGFGLLLIISFFVFLFKMKRDKEDLSWSELSKEITIGEVTDRAPGSKGSFRAVLSFIVDGKAYRKDIDVDYIKGEKFKVEYSVKNPNKSRVLKEYPLFTKGEKTSFVIGKLTNYNSFFSTSLRYEYWVGNKKYERRHYQKENSDELYPYVEEGQLFVVEYWEKDPRRSIIYLDRHIDYISRWWNYKVDVNGKIYK